jgi:hypothetical protein
MLNVFRGGPLHDSAYTVAQLISFEGRHIPIEQYTWTQEKRNGARVWAWKYCQNLEEELLSMSHTQPSPTLVEQMWIEIDALYNKLNNDNVMNSDQVLQLKGHMRGLCWAIRLFMNPYFRTTDEVVREVHKRHVMREAGEAYETPGLGTRSGEPIPGSHSKYATTNIKPVPPSKHQLSDEQIQKIRGAREAGFPIDELSKMYKLSVGEIRSL